MEQQGANVYAGQGNLPPGLHGGHVCVGTQVNVSGQVRPAAQGQRQVAAIVFHSALDAPDPKIRSIGERQGDHAILNPQIRPRINGPQNAKKTSDGSSDPIAKRRIPFNRRRPWGFQRFRIHENPDVGGSQGQSADAQLAFEDGQEPGIDRQLLCTDRKCVRTTQVDVVGLQVGQGKKADFQVAIIQCAPGCLGGFGDDERFHPIAVGQQVGGQNSCQQKGHDDAGAPDTDQQ